MAESMKPIYAIFDFLKESSMMESLPSYDFPSFFDSERGTYSVDLIPRIITELDTSSFADQMWLYERDIVEDGGMEFMSIPQMKEVYTTAIMHVLYACADPELPPDMIRTIVRFM